ncbi:N-acetyltransferase [Lysobacter pythonis]|uniref:N-acetyltransferase n=1 Tax=Solilutibacter pythonis TaxID=2483112 RepID=A0A3M2HWN6_9GAMM|nr:GNAT family N-acetyltransferase [Lysobacter pythonis]RMH94136.1 N-acetyltransferase [Lysobacter pythonis]
MSLSLRERVPDTATYRHLRREAGLSEKSEAAAVLGLPRSLYSVMLFDGETPVGMGRVIGDGGLFFQVVDIAVLPAWQGRGHGKRIMSAIAGWLRANVPASGYVSLIADGEARHLYARYGFLPTAPVSIGMYWLSPGGAG